jgi:hypothetical protein
MFVVVDLDGTIADDSLRSHLAEAKQWDAYHEASANDTPYYDVKLLMRMIEQMRNIETIVLTGRTDNYRPLTVDWLIRNDIATDHLLMRPSGDFRPAHEVKWDLLIEFFKTERRMRKEILMMLDNSRKDVETWRDKGFSVWQVR